MRRALHLNDLQAHEAANAMIDMDHQVSGVQRCQFRDEIAGFLLALAAAHQPVTENVLLRNYRQIVGFKTGFQSKHDNGNHVL